MNEIRPDPQRCVHTSETGLTKKTASGKTLGIFPQFLRFQKQQNKTSSKGMEKF